METKDYIVAIDLGDSNIVVAVASAADGGRINIEHILSRPSEGVSAGQIMNIDLAVKTIKGAIDELRDTTGIEVKEAYAGISGEFIYCTPHTDHVFVPDHKNGVTQQVVETLFERMGNVLVSEDRTIMERIPQRYIINDTTEVDNPVGVFGSPLSSTFNFISSDNIPLGRLNMALSRLHIAPRRIFSNAVVVGDAVLSPDEKEEGVVVVDIGSDLTDIAIYHRNILRYISTIPIGAKSINNDIRTLTIPERYIEALKLKYGCAMAAKAPQDFSVIIKGRSKHDQREIAVYNLAAVIEARVRDIAELVGGEITDSGFVDKVPYGIVLTGGSAQLRSIDELFRDVTGFEVRVAEPEDIISPPTRTRITSSSDSTVVGLLLHGLKYGACKVEQHEPIVVPPTRPFNLHEGSNIFEPPTSSSGEAAPVQPPVERPKPSVPPLPVNPPVSKPTEAPLPPRPINSYAQEREEREARVAATRAAQAAKERQEQERQEQERQEREARAAAEVAAEPEIKEEINEEEEIKEAAPASAVETPKKRHLFKWIDSITTKANKLVDNVNDAFDVNDEV